MIYSDVNPLYTFSRPPACGDRTMKIAEEVTAAARASGTIVRTTASRASAEPACAATVETAQTCRNSDVFRDRSARCR